MGAWLFFEFNPDFQKMLSTYAVKLLQNLFAHLRIRLLLGHECRDSSSVRAHNPRLELLTIDLGILGTDERLAG